MIIVDSALQKRVAEGSPIRLAVFGAGFSARHLAAQIISSFPGIHLAVIVNRTPAHAVEVFRCAGINDPVEINSESQLQDIIASHAYSFCTDPQLVMQCDSIDVVLETTGDVEYGAAVATQAIQAKKHVVAINCEMDATIGPLLGHMARQQDVVYTNTDGDEPGVAMNLSRFVRSIGFEVVGAGNLKGYYDPYRTPETQRAFAEANNQKPRAVTSFVDGTKLSMELTVLANGLGFGVAKRGMYGPACDDVKNCLQAFPKDAFLPGNGVVDFLLGAAPHTGAFVIGYSEQPMKHDYMKYLKMGDGPHYVFYTPFHLPQLEVPLTVARAALFGDATISPNGAPTCEAITIAKRDLAAGQILDGLGGFDSFALIENYSTAQQQNCLPMGLSGGCKLRRPVKKDDPITYADVELPKGRLIDRLRVSMQELFSLDSRVNQNNEIDEGKTL